MLADVVQNAWTKGPIPLEMFHKHSAFSNLGIYSCRWFGRNWRRKIRSDSGQSVNELSASLCLFTGALRENDCFDVVHAWASVSQSQFLSRPALSLWAFKISHLSLPKRDPQLSDAALWKLRGNYFAKEEKYKEACFAYLASLHMQPNLSTVLVLAKALIS